MGSFAVTEIFFCAFICVNNVDALNVKRRFRKLESRINTLELDNNENAIGILNNSDSISRLNETIIMLNQFSQDEWNFNTQSSVDQSKNVRIKDHDDIHQYIKIFRAFAQEKMYIRQYEIHMNEVFSEFKTEMRKATEKENATLQNMLDKFASTMDSLQAVLNASLDVLELKQTEDNEFLKSAFETLTAEQAGLKAKVKEISRDIGPVVDHWKRCRIGWTRHKGFVYKYFNENEKYAEAGEACESCSSHVSDIQDEDEMTFVMGLTDQPFWLGATETEAKGTWIWDRTGNEPKYTNWYPGEPDGGTDMQCLLASYLWPSGLWHAWWCNGSRSYVCKYKQV